MAQMNRQWVLNNRPDGAVAATDLTLKEAPVRPLADGEILVRNIYLSLDPTNRLWMSDREQYLPPVGIGDVMRGGTIGVVEESRSSRFAAGDIVMPGDAGWQLYTVTHEKMTSRVRTVPGVPLTAYMSVLGSTGMTAYFGLLDICDPKEGETLVVSAAAGAVGSIVGQIAKIKGARIVGIAGGEAKCRWLTNELGFDAAIDYKNEDVGAALDRHCPDAIDMNFENVGGPIMDAVFSRMAKHGRMALCGMISGYNADGPLAGPTDFGQVLMKRLTIRGFIVIDYFPRAREAIADLSQWIAEGRIRWKDHVVDGIENAPSALERLFTGNHDGKLMVKISPEP
ncbi:NADP-dependent oxidoreductase [Sphingobium sp. HBC34]|uniref:NADP-dependent oxidoreductase n=1 Tax=Sphingobium cyanobacteriorum TaxID=3063954 RepID=A0ABT8ZPG0_9SPHN|nr:NADP-dependent oxidoreductase [Sphingobium sp. HBC34]MDO7836413.1 NADP-dependent oxidoreductase [Sphingobium sp. HBC34]